MHSNHTRRGFLLSTASLLLARAQDQEPTFTTDVKVVSVLATVFNKQGQIVHDLGKDDFQILENGRPQTIKYFSRDSDLPLTIGLMVDTSMSQVHVLDAERAASFRFVDKVLREDKDKVFVMQFDMAVQTPQPLTSSREKLEQALAVRRHPYPRRTQPAIWRRHAALRCRGERVEQHYENSAGPQSADHSFGRRREWQRHQPAGFDRRGPQGRHHDLLDSLRGQRGPRHSGADVARNRRRVLRSHEKAAHRPDLRRDSG